MDGCLRPFHVDGIAKVNPVIPRFFRLLATFILLLVFAVYAGDFLFLRFKMATGKAGAPFGLVTVYQAAAMKSGKVEVYYSNPSHEVCVHALFPHEGHAPCWYLNRAPIKLISAYSGRRELLEASAWRPPA
jgi:hypothetical protein